MEVFDAGREGEGFTKTAEFDAFCAGAKSSLERLLDECADDV
jgi:hypothetical protein